MVEEMIEDDLYEGVEEVYVEDYCEDFFGIVVVLFYQYFGGQYGVEEGEVGVLQVDYFGVDVEWLVCLDQGVGVGNYQCYVDQVWQVFVEVEQ